jgi:hypothetical protein
MAWGAGSVRRRSGGFDWHVYFATNEIKVRTWPDAGWPAPMSHLVQHLTAMHEKAVAQAQSQAMLA